MIQRGRKQLAPVTLPEIDSEHVALLACALAPPGAVLDEALAPLVDAAFRWDRFARSAAAHRVRPQVRSAMGRLMGKLPAAREAHKEAEDVARVSAGHALFMCGELINALDALHSGRVAALPFKGPAFAELVGGGAASREMDDLDLLLPRAAMAAAVRALESLGYRSGLRQHAIESPWLDDAGHELGLVREPDGMLIELHWRLAPPWYREACSPAEALAASAQRDFFTARIPWPSAEHLLLLHVADGMKSCGCGVRWVADVAAILRRHADIRWDDVRATAQRHEALDTLRIGLATVRSLCAELAARLDIPDFALRLPPAAARLADEAVLRARPRRAIAAIRRRIASDSREIHPGANFRWALLVADHPAAAAGAIVRYLCGPAIADMRELPDPPGSALGIRLRAARRRLTRGG